MSLFFTNINGRIRGKKIAAITIEIDINIKSMS
jgi:hypothetical protein